MPPLDQDTPERAETGGAELSDEQMESLLGGESPNREIPMSSEDATPSSESAPAPEGTPGSGEQPAPAAASAQAAAPASELEFTWNGKQIKAPFTDPRVQKWAAQGYDYSQRMAEFNRRAQEFEQRQKQIAELEGRYKPIDEYVSQNPDFWEHVQATWEAKAKGQDPNNPLARELAKVKEVLTDVTQFKEQVLQERTLAQQKQEDEALAAEIDSVAKAYPTIDMKAVDAEGKSLEYRVLEHAAKNGIHSFRAAFRDLHHDAIVKLEAERAKEAAAKEIQKNKSLGILGKTPTPKKGATKAENIKTKSYDDLMREGAEEEGISYR